MTSQPIHLSTPDIGQTAAAITTEFRESPYRVEYPAPNVVRVEIDVIDATWWDFLRRTGWKSVYTYDVEFQPETGTCSITDIRCELRWSMGIDRSFTPQLTRSKSVSKGRIVTYKRVKITTPTQGTVVDVSFNSEEARSRIRRILKEHGWQERMGRSEKAGVIGAAIGIGLAVVAMAAAAIVVLVVG